MPVCRTEFLIDADLVQDGGQNEGVLFEDEAWRIVLNNGASDVNGNVLDLIATVTGPASDLSSARNEHRELLADKLNYLAIVTQSRFQIVAPIRAIDWTPSVGERKMILFQEFDGRKPPPPQLFPELVAAAKTLASIKIEDFSSKALRYFRLGLIDVADEDRFVRFWHALEIVAEGTKVREPISITCRHCKEDMKCAQCGQAATRYPMATDAISDLVARISEGDGALYKRIKTARDTLLHGGSIERVEKNTGMAMTDIVDELGKIVWLAIINTIPTGTQELVFAAVETFAHKTGILSSEILFENPGPADQPQESHIPKIAITLHHQWRDVSE